MARTVRAPFAVSFLALFAGTLSLFGPARACSAQACPSEWFPGSDMPGSSDDARQVVCLPNGDVVATSGYGSVGGRSSFLRFEDASQAWFDIPLVTKSVPYSTTFGYEVSRLQRARDGRWIMSVDRAPGRAIGYFDGENWSPIASTFDGYVETFLELADGSLLVGGAITSIDGVPFNNVARWNGTSWVAMGDGLNSTVTGLVQRPNGDVIASGLFAKSGSNAVLCMARWNGAAWVQVPDAPNGSVVDMKLNQAGDVIVCGKFSAAGRTIARNVARWDGINWYGPSVGPNDAVLAVSPLPDGSIAVGGTFTAIGAQSASCFATWDGSTWKTFPSFTAPCGPQVSDIAVNQRGEIVICGRLGTAGATHVRNFARWDGSAWRGFGEGLDNVAYAVLAMPDDTAIIGGAFTGCGTTTLNRIGRWDGVNWTPLGDGFDKVVLTLARAANGDVLAGGDFTKSGTSAMAGVARWNGHEWLPLGQGVVGTVYSIVELPDGSIVVGGFISKAGGKPVSCIARWDGAAWTDMGTQFITPGSSSVKALCTGLDGTLYVGGTFSLQPDPEVQSYTYNVAAWKDGKWSRLAQGSDYSVNGLRRLSNGSIAAVGRFEVLTNYGIANVELAAWTGWQWDQLPGAGYYSWPSYLLTFTELSNKKLLLGGWDLPGPGGRNAISEPFTPWSPLMFSQPNDAVLAMDTLPSGDIVIAGEFTSVGGQPSAFVARRTQGYVPQVANWSTVRAIRGKGDFMIDATAAGTEETNYRWQWGHWEYGDSWTDLQDGFDRHLGTVSGTRSAVLQVTQPVSNYEIYLRCIVANACGENAVQTRLTMCAGDFNLDRYIDHRDFDAFIVAFEAGDSAADFDGDGFLTFDDFDAFVQEFERGCPYVF